MFRKSWKKPVGGESRDRPSSPSSSLRPSSSASQGKEQPALSPRYKLDVVPMQLIFLGRWRKKSASRNLQREASLRMETDVVEGGEPESRAGGGWPPLRLTSLNREDEAVVYDGQTDPSLLQCDRYSDRRRTSVFQDHVLCPDDPFVEDGGSRSAKSSGRKRFRKKSSTFFCF